ncbi:hypothetical protein OH407_23730, partial [Salmonella enterica]|uniref:hypothetical protein n=1 Tax=Salmonella enterica TaxID=28901 RepID=UPI0022B73A39
MSVYENRPPNLLAILETSVKKFPEKPALIQDRMLISYRDFGHITTGWADRFITQFGIHRGDRIALLMKNT